MVSKKMAFQYLDSWYLIYRSESILRSSEAHLTGSISWENDQEGGEEILPVGFLKARSTASSALSACDQVKAGIYDTDVKTEHMGGIPFNTRLEARII